MAPSKFDVTPEQLESINTEEGLAHNVKALRALGGPIALAEKLRVKPDHGISEDDVSDRIEHFGSNVVSLWYSDS